MWNSLTRDKSTGSMPRGNRFHGVRSLLFEHLECRELLSANGGITDDDPTGNPAAVSFSTPARQMEDLNRGLIALRRASGEIYIGWRMLGTDPILNSRRANRSPSPRMPR